VTNLQLYLAIGLPIIVNIIFNGVIFLALNARIADLRTDVKGELGDFKGEIGKRFDDLKELWRSELRRVEEVLDARLKHIEESRS
jgi:hypothetical protein